MPLIYSKGFPQSLSTVKAPYMSVTLISCTQLFTPIPRLFGSDCLPVPCLFSWYRISLTFSSIDIAFFFSVATRTMGPIFAIPASLFVLDSPWHLLFQRFSFWASWRRSHISYRKFCLRDPRKDEVVLLILGEQLNSTISANKVDTRSSVPKTPKTPIFKLGKRSRSFNTELQLPISVLRYILVQTFNYQYFKSGR